ncbi:MAG: NTP transferase domain-containing protein [Candidatus Omnitrophota bacterium]|jgi:bifunctional UDP-N-acetylglucosamine pyrophosphorylase/glucosamine-1-phosphate N-acetyltransferase
MPNDISFAKKSGNNSNFTAIVLAAGKGVRMKSELPKVLHTLSGKPLIGYCLEQLKSIKNIKQIIVVTGYGAQSVETYVKNNFKGVEFARQKKLLGTADAVKCARAEVKYENVLILCADAPLITAETLSSFMASYESEKLTASIITAYIDKKNDLGRIIRDTYGAIKSICEVSDLRKHINLKISLKEVNSGIYAFNRRTLFENLKYIKRNEIKGEYYFTDTIEILYNNGIKIGSYVLSDSDEILGINSPRELSLAERIINKRVVEYFMASGVRIMDPQSTFIAENVKIGKNTLIYPFTFIERNVIIGVRCEIGPFAHLRQGVCISDDTAIGNFTEISRSKVGKNTRIKQFSYIGDATIGDNVNIGAGTVVANYNGKTKNKTIIEKGASIGSDSVLVAPVKIGKSAITGAGSVVLKNVKGGETVVGVPAQVLKKNRKLEGRKTRDEGR